MEIIAKILMGGFFIALVTASVCAIAMIVRDSTDGAKPPL